MLNYDKNKVYMLNILFSERAPVTNVIVPGKNLEEVICEYKDDYPDLKKSRFTRPTPRKQLQ